MKQLVLIFTFLFMGFNLQATISPETEISNFDKYKEVTRCQRKGLDMLSVVECYEKLLGDNSALELSVQEKENTQRSFKNHLATCQVKCNGWTCYKIEYKHCAVTKVLNELRPKYQTSRQSNLSDDEG